MQLSCHQPAAQAFNRWRRGSKVPLHTGGDTRSRGSVFGGLRHRRKDSPLQRQYRGLDKPTDVLSFPGEDRYLGDILISSETAYNQASKSQTLTFETNVQRLILHGLLHLMGYDHETDHGEMRAMEHRLRRRFQC